MKKINVLKPKFRTKEILSVIEECLDKGWTGIGFKTTEFEDAWKRYTKFPNAHFISSNTVGLHLALNLFKNKYKDTETKPDYKGTCTDPSGKVWELASWVSKTNEGEAYMSIKLQEVYVKPEESAPKRDGRNEPTPAVQILMNPKISLTPHIGAATDEAQDRIGTELASQIISILKTENA